MDIFEEWMQQLVKQEAPTIGFVAVVTALAATTDTWLVQTNN